MCPRNRSTVLGNFPELSSSQSLFCAHCAAHVFKQSTHCAGQLSKAQLLTALPFVHSLCCRSLTARSRCAAMRYQFQPRLLLLREGQA
eukprot:scaffold109996_cov19-Tisochrysis_lutea.AAC.1